MNCCDHNECCDHSNDRIGAEIGMLHNLLRRQMACMTEKTANAANVTGMQAMIVHHLIIHEKQGDLVLTEQARAMDEYITERMQQMEQLLRQGITEDELKGWFAVCEKIRSNLEQYQCNMCREGQK